MSDYTNHHIDILRLYRTKSVGPILFKQLIARYGSASEALRHIGDLSVKGGRKTPLKPISKSDAEKELDGLTAIGGKMLFYNDDDFSQLLYHIDDRPAVLSVLGRAEILNDHIPKIAVIGSRNASSNALAMAKRYGMVLSQKGFTIVSGLAIGVDGAAHSGAIENEELQHNTIAVLAGGVDHIYPKQHTSLYHDIVKHGAVVSEMPLGMSAQARHFPRRNRIVSGLSIGTLVIEASLRSGSLITARLANEQGRYVFAVPGSPTMANARGCNSLIKDGAYLAETPDDIIPVLQESLTGHNLYEQRDDDVTDITLPDVDTAEITRKLMELLSSAPTSLTQLASNCDIGHNQIRAALVELSLAGKVEWLAGDCVCLSYKGNKIEDLF